MVQSSSDSNGNWKMVYDNWKMVSSWKDLLNLWLLYEMQTICCHKTFNVQLSRRSPSSMQRKIKGFFVFFVFWHNKMSCTQWSSNVSSTMICKYMVPPKFCLCLKSKERWEIYQIFLYNCDQVTVKILLLPGSYIRLLLLHRTISPIFRDKSF